jgi:dihydropteroate synthase
MGILNTTPDSFYPASRSANGADALERGRRMFAAGADVVDVGGESTRPGATPVSEIDELARVLPAVSALAPLGAVSIDTSKPGVARAAVAAGARIINDVSCTLVELAGELGVGYVAMHRRGDSATMELEPVYDDVVGEVHGFLVDAARRARAAGVGELWLDPGIGFAKTAAHNLALLARVDELVALAAGYGAGVLIGTSRKRFLGTLAPQPLEVDDRLEGSLATEAWALVHGASMVRVHDVNAAVQLRDLLSRPLEEVTA